MTKLDDLIAAHPLLFRGAHPLVPSGLPAGWYALVDELCTGIESVLGQDGCASFAVMQIKEKCAGMRFYFSLDGAEDRFMDIHSDAGLHTLIQRADGPPAMDSIRDLVKLAARASQVTCQKCGAPGKRVVRSGWVAALCGEHAGEKEE